MQFRFPPEFVLFDLEYTAWEESQSRNWSGPNEYREVIQVGAIHVVGTELTESASFLEYVRPVKNPMLSDFVIGLTGISQLDIDTKGLAFLEAFNKFKIFVGSTPVFCWGKDIEILEENTVFADASEILSTDQFKNLRPLMRADFVATGINIDDYTSGTLIQAFGKDTGRRAHDAVNDMRNLLDALRELRKK